MGSSARIAGMCLALAAASAAQGPPPPGWQVRILEPGRASGLELLPPDRAGGLVSRLSWIPDGGGEPIVVTLARPVQDCAAAVTADGQGLIVLAGGIRSSLDLYLVDRREPRPHVYPTSGGRRLPESFNGGLGSWPLVEGLHLVLFAFEKERRLEFRALDFQGRILASDNMPFEEVRGFSAESDPETNRLRIGFHPIDRELLFWHPLAPRMDLDQGPLSFGSPLVGREVFREVEMKNSGARELRVEMTASGRGFRVDGPTDMALEPGRVAKVRVGFTPEAGGSFDGQLLLQANSPNPRRRVALQGEGLEPGVEEPLARPTPPARVERVVEDETVMLPTAENAPRPGALPTRPQVKFLEIGRLSADRVRVTGMLRVPEGSDAAAVELQVRDQTVRATLGPGGAFAVAVPASPGQWLRLSSVSGADAVSPSVVIGQVLPALRRVGDTVEVRALPGRRFLIAAVALEAESERVQRVWAVWEGRTDLEGVARVDLDILGPRRVAMHVLAFSDDRDGMRRSNLLRLEPDS